MRLWVKWIIKFSRMSRCILNQMTDFLLFHRQRNCHCLALSLLSLCLVHTRCRTLFCCRWSRVRGSWYSEAVTYNAYSWKEHVGRRRAISYRVIESWERSQKEVTGDPLLLASVIWPPEWTRVTWDVLRWHTSKAASETPITDAENKTGAQSSFLFHTAVCVDRKHQKYRFKKNLVLANAQ